MREAGDAATLDDSNPVMRRVVLGLLVVFLLGVAMAAVATVPEHQTSFHAPIFTADGTAVIAVRRDLDLWVLGPGLEMLTPPARVRVRRDRYRVVRLDRRTGADREMVALPPSPLEGTWTHAYRAHTPGLGSVRASLSWRGSDLEWAVSVGVREDGREGTSVLTSADVPPAWRPAGPSIGGSDERATLSGDDEVLVVPSAPCAVVLLHEARRTVRALSGPETCGRHPPALDYEAVRFYARRRSIERAAELASLRARFVAEGRARGMGDGDAELHAIDELERLGYLPRPPQLVAAPIARDDAASRRAAGTLVPLFTISPMEFRVGLFPDIQAAIESPGTEVRYQGPYLRHDDYATSQVINSFLAGGGQAFFVETVAGTWALRVVPRREASR
jgi:hypothetical protein